MNNDLLHEERFDFASRLAKMAGNILNRDHPQVDINGNKPGRQNIVTNLDLTIDEFVTDSILQQFPDDKVISEESKISPDYTGKVWIVDPLDGTKNYFNQHHHYGVSIAFTIDGKTQFGIVYAPEHNHVYSAYKGHKARMDGFPIEMKNPDQQEYAKFSTGFSYLEGQDLEKALNQFKRNLDDFGDFSRFGAASLDICHVARGIIGVFYEPGLKPWDVAAASLILKQSGGIVSDYSGNPIDLTKDRIDIVAAKNEYLHEKVLNNLN